MIYFYFQLGITVFVLLMTVVFVMQVFKCLPKRMAQLDKPRQKALQDEQVPLVEPTQQSKNENNTALL